MALGQGQYPELMAVLYWGECALAVRGAQPETTAMKKVLIVLGVILVALPLLPKLMPVPFSYERVQQVFEGSGLTVSDVKDDPGSFMEAIDGKAMQVNGARVGIYHFDNEGKIAKQLEYNKTDAGTAIVETWNLSESLGAAKPKNLPMDVARNGMYLLRVESEDKALRARIVKAFKSV